MTEIKFYSGMRTIGGTVISITYEQHRLIFDFGYVVKPVFDEYLKPRKLTDKLRMQMLPKVEGIFSKEELGDYDVQSCEDSKLETAFFISHMHLDHMSSLEHIGCNIPIFMSSDSKTMYKALVDVGEQKALNNLFGKPFNEPFVHGPFILTILPVDHDVPGASGLMIESPDGTITYTGDIRFHGHDPSLSHKFIEKARNTDVLISEGVTISFIEEDRVLVPNPELPEGARTEQILMADFEAVCQSHTGSVFFNIYHRNIYRILNIIDMANKNNRKPVLEYETAKLISHFTDQSDFLVLDYNIGGYDLPYKTISPEDISKSKDAFLMQMSYGNTMTLLDMNLEDAAYIHSNGTPLGDYDPAYARLTLLLEMLGLEFISLPCGGHAHPDQLKYMVEAISPKTLVPYHSFAPQHLMNDKGNQILPEPGDRYMLTEGQFTKISD